MKTENSYEQKCILQLKVGQSDGGSFIRDMYFTAPFKIMKPFVQENHLKAILLYVSAGILRGDAQEVEIDLEENAYFELTTQSYEKIYAMPYGKATRKGCIRIGSGARFYYHPLPVLPFARAKFQQNWQVHLADEHSHFLFAEILSYGRAARGERFCYREYRSLLEVYCGRNLIYEDNACYNPDEMDLDDVLAYEGYTHLLNFVWLGSDAISPEEARRITGGMPDILAGASRVTGGTCVKALADGSEPLLTLEKVLSGKFFMAVKRT